MIDLDLRSENIRLTGISYVWKQGSIVKVFAIQTTLVAAMSATISNSHVKCMAPDTLLVECNPQRKSDRILH